MYIYNICKCLLTCETISTIDFQNICNWFTPMVNYIWQK